MPEPEPASIPPVPPGQKTLDSKTVEVLALTVFRRLFGTGVRVPVKLKGALDMDVVVRGSDVVLNLNQLELKSPELLIWRFIFAYQGKPVVEYGRGIKDDMKIHFPNLIFFLLVLWRERRKKYKAKALADAARSHEMVARSVAHAKPRPVEERAL